MTTVCHDPSIQRRAELVAGSCIAGGRAEFCAGGAARRSASFGALADGDRAAVALVIGMLALCAFYGLLALRAHDDNRLTSWLWVFADRRGMALGPLLLLAVVAAWPLAGLRVQRRWAPTLLGLAALGVSMLMWTEPQVIVDTARYFAQAKYLEAHGVVAFLREWGHAVPAWTDLPLIPLTYGLLFRVFGESVLAVQCFTTLCFVGAVLVTCWIGRELWDERVGLYGGALLLGMPFLLSQVHHTFSTANRLRASFDLPVLGTISAVSFDSYSRRKRIEIASFSVVLAGLVVAYVFVMTYRIGPVALWGSS